MAWRQQQRQRLVRFRDLLTATVDTDNDEDDDEDMNDDNYDRIFSPTQQPSQPQRNLLRPLFIAPKSSYLIPIPRKQQQQQQQQQQQEEEKTVTTVLQQQQLQQQQQRPTVLPPPPRQSLPPPPPPPLSAFPRPDPQVAPLPRQSLPPPPPPAFPPPEQHEQEKHQQQQHTQEKEEPSRKGTTTIMPTTMKIMKSPPPPTTPKSIHNRAAAAAAYNNNNNRTSASSRGGIAEIFVPSPSATAISSLAVSMDASLLSPSSSSSLLYSHCDSSSNNNNNNKTFHTAHTTSTQFKTLEKLEWLELEYIQQCESVTNLVRIVSILQNEERVVYPSLLRAAKERLEKLHNSSITNNSGDVVDQPEVASPPRTDSPSSVVDECTATTSSRSHHLQQQQRRRRQQSSMPSSSRGTVFLDDHSSSGILPDPATFSNSQSSLIMSLSTDDDQEHKEEAFRGSPAWSLRSETKPPPGQQLLLQETAPTVTPLLGVREHGLLHDDDEDDGVSKFVTYDVNSTHVLCEMELQQENVDRQRENALLQDVERLRQQNRQLQEQIQKKLADREQRRQEANAQQEELNKQLEQLQARLDNVHYSKAMMEKDHQSKLVEIRQMLKKTRGDLERIKADRDAMIQCLLHATGKKIKPGKKVSEADRQKLVADISHQNVANQKAIDAMTRLLAENDHDRRTALEAQRKAEGQCIEATKEIRQLARENSALLAHIQRLTEDLSQSHAKIDEILGSANHQQLNDLKEKVSKYERAIKTMRVQLRSQDNTISMDLYRKAVADAKHHELAYKKYKDECALLAARVAQLEKGQQCELGTEQKANKVLLSTKHSSVQFAGASASKRRLSIPLPLHERGQRNEVKEEKSGTNQRMANLETCRQSEVVTDRRKSKTNLANRAPLHSRKQSKVKFAEHFPTESRVSTSAPSQDTRKVKFAKLPVKPDLPKFASSTDSLPSEGANDNTQPLPKTPSRMPLPTSEMKTPARLAFSPVVEKENKAFTRVHMVKAAGGRRGLQEKLRQIRSRTPTPTKEREAKQSYQNMLEKLNIRPRPLRRRHPNTRI